MCGKQNLTRGLTTASVVMAFLGILCITLGSIMIGRNDFNYLLGSRVSSLGGGIIFMGFFYFATTVLAVYGAKFHNKFLLMVCWMVLLFVTFLHLLLGGLTISLTVTPEEFNFEFQEICLTKGTLVDEAQVELCQPYFNSDFYAGINLVWQFYYHLSEEDSSYTEVMQELQQSQFCCGLGPPTGCQANDQVFPDRFPIPDWTDARNEQKQCAPDLANYYPATFICKENARCPYDQPIGTCGVIAPTDRSRGCAHEMHQWIVSQVAVLGNLILLLTSFPILFIIMSICLCLKRKDSDVLPPLEFLQQRDTKDFLASRPSGI